MNVVLDLRDVQSTEIQELLTTIQMVYAEQCRQFGSTISQRAAVGESVAELNAEAQERTRKLNTFTQANLLRIAIADFLQRMKDHPEQVIELFAKSELIRYRGNPNHRKLVLPAPLLKPKVTVTRRKY